MGVCNCSVFCCTLLYVHSCIAIILMEKRELVALLNLSSGCLVMVEQLFLAVPRGCGCGISSSYSLTIYKTNNYNIHDLTRGKRSRPICSTHSDRSHILSLFPNLLNFLFSFFYISNYAANIGNSINIYTVNEERNTFQRGKITDADSCIFSVQVSKQRGC